MRIGGLQKLTLLDYPGHLAAAVFVKGCNFRCPFCFNRDLVLGNLPTVSRRTVLSFLKKRKKVLDGVVLGGGEPTLQPDLIDFLKQIKKLVLEIMIETNGSKPEVLEKLIKDKLVDFVAMDFKTTFEDYEKMVCYFDPGSKKIYDSGSLVNRVKKSMRLIIDSGLPYEFRSTVVPTIHDEKTLLKMAKELKRLITNHRSLTTISWVLQPFQPKNCLDSKFSKIKPFAQKQMESFLKIVQKVIPGTRIK